MKQFEVKVQLQGGRLTLPVKVYAVFVQLILCLLCVAKKIPKGGKKKLNLSCARACILFAKFRLV
jgi:hypothetical protein